MTQRYYCEARLVADQCVTLVGPEAHHMRDVRRLGAGDLVSLFDGRGVECIAEIVTAKRGAVELRVLECMATDREVGAPITLGVALPKGERQRWLVEKVVELGVMRLTPLATERGVAEATTGAIARLERAVIEATKQCGRNRLMQIAPPVSLQDFLAEPRLGAERWIAHPATPSNGASDPQGNPAPWEPARGESPIWLAIGPEGGFTDAEIALADVHGWRRVSLGASILRVETAAIALATLAAARHWR